MFLQALRCLQSSLFTYLRAKKLSSRFNAFCSAHFGLSAFYANWLGVFFQKERYKSVPLFLLPRLLRRMSMFMLSSFSAKSSSAWRLLFPFLCLLIHPIVSRGSSSLGCLHPAGHNEGGITGVSQVRGESSLHHPPRTYVGFPGQLEEVQAGSPLYILCLSPSDLLKALHIVLRDRHVVVRGFSARYLTFGAILGSH